MKRLLLFLATAFFVFFTIRAWRAGDNDFVAYYNAGKRVFAGHSPYVPEATPFRYLPFTAYFFAPLSVFSFRVARMIFFFANFWAAFAIYQGFYRRIGALATLLLLGLFIRFHNHDFQNAQVNPLLLLLFFYWWENRKKNLIFPTLAFSVFASFKLVPFALVLPLLYRKRWGELTWITLWTVVLNFIPIFLIDNGPFAFKEWFDQAKAIGYPVPLMSNIQSIPSALWWWLQDRADPATFLIGIRIFQAALLASVVLFSPKVPEDRSFDWMTAGILAATVIIAPLAWKHNYLQFLPLAYLWFREDPDFWKVRTRVLYGTALFGLVILPSSLSVWDKEWTNRSYIMAWSGLLVLILSLKYSRSRSEFGNRLPLLEA